MHEVEWGMPVVIYLYFGGLSAGVFILSAFLAYLRDPKLHQLAAFGAYFAPFPLFIGLFLLLIDLDRPLYFWKLFVTIQWTSPMSIGSWLLMFFSIIASLYAILWLPEKYSTLKLGKLKLSIPKNRLKIRGILGAIGLPTGVAVGIYTGVLLGAIPARPFWNTPMVAMLFLVSAISTATAVMLFASNWMSKNKSKEDFHHERKLLYSADVILIILEMFIIVPYILHNSISTASQSASLDLILGGEYTNIFWYGFVLVGLVIPLILETIDLIPEIARKQKSSHIKFFGYLSAVLVLVGGFLLRYIFIYAGQASSFGA